MHICTSSETFHWIARNNNNGFACATAPTRHCHQRLHSRRYHHICMCEYVYRQFWCIEWRAVIVLKLTSDPKSPAIFQNVLAAERCIEEIAFENCVRVLSLELGHRENSYSHGHGRHVDRKWKVNGAHVHVVRTYGVAGTNLHVYAKKKTLWAL